jgi:hypothetical protein
LEFGERGIWESREAECARRGSDGEVGDLHAIDDGRGLLMPILTEYQAKEAEMAQRVVCGSKKALEGGFW